MIPPSVISAVQICVSLGIQKAVISPGSRNAPLTIALVRHPDIQTYTISDERSAAFIGLGIARQLLAPVALVCTSGSAAYNYAPAVAEAYFQQIPLIIFTADRPPEWIDQLDGQTIRQRGIYGKHVKESYELPVGQTEADLWHAGRLVAEAINLSKSVPYGPVHVNVPIREPFYPEEGEELHFDSEVKVIRTVLEKTVLSSETVQQLYSEWNKHERKLIVVGQQPLQPALATTIENVSQKHQIPVVADIITNQHPVNEAIRHADTFLTLKDEKIASELRPDLLITFGLSVISKNLKLFLRKHRPKEHWHIQPSGQAADTFQSLSHVLPTDPATFFQQIEDWEASGDASEFYQSWITQEQHATERINNFFKSVTSPYSEFQAVFTILKSLPNQVNLHLANSMAVRYANLIGLSEKQGQVEVWANRGTSGIDGSNSTAVGAALASDRLNVLITGDLAFFYDRNAFWHNYPLPNLRIILLNNHAGGIFRMIDGPSRQPELEEYFETKQQLEAENTARDFGMEYQRLDFTSSSAIQKLNALLPGFFHDHSDHVKIVEIVTDSAANASVFRQFKKNQEIR
uniref:2-succinyl-5-enolpyruvyl-6-hydroxy-3-cyclohexene-1-carboxylate synthase n=1 Tax=Roseihalotalea indica TaxID=2867963 RepID=A0AA49JH49_9BACT|nr:2-succinyl-5-enolpyruvyl-6-hydroxy-3-cyclohexene-1-carboxylic-acid synthase [Tunicatimonas sp. TK19036]